jgi:hypothetical protein
VGRGADEPADRLQAGGAMLETLSEIIVRPSVEDDVSAMLAIYNHHIQRGLGEFDVEPLHSDDIKRRRKNMLNRRLPHPVAELDATVVGYAYAVPFRKRPAYRIGGLDRRGRTRSLFAHARMQNLQCRPTRFESYMPSQPESSRARLCMNPDPSGG